MNYIIRFTEYREDGAVSLGVCSHLCEVDEIHKEENVKAIAKKCFWQHCDTAKLQTAKLLVSVSTDPNNDILWSGDAFLINDQLEHIRIDRCCGECQHVLRIHGGIQRVGLLQELSRVGGKCRDCDCLNFDWGRL